MKTSLSPCWSSQVRCALNSLSLTFSLSYAHFHHPGILLKCRFQLQSSGVTSSQQHRDCCVFSSAGPCPPQLAMPASMETLQCDDTLKASEEDTWVTEEPRKIGSFLHFPSCMRSTESHAVLQVFNGIGEGARYSQNSGSWASGYPTFYSNCIHIYTSARPERQQQ